LRQKIALWRIFPAISLGFIWLSLVVQELVKQLPGTLNSFDKKEKLPPFLLAATVPSACPMDLLQVGKHYDTEAIATTISELL
jgi:hypothetical protein